MFWPSDLTDKKRLWLLIGGVIWLLISLLLVGLAELQRAKGEFTTRTDSLYRLLLQRVDQNEAVLTGFVAVVNTLDASQLEHARSYGAEMLANYPYVAELGVLVPVRGQDLNGFFTRFHTLHSGARLTQYAAAGPEPLTTIDPQRTYYPICFNEPPNPPLLGMDPTPAPYFGKALQRAVDSGATVASSPFPLMKSTGGKLAGMVLFKAAYGPGASPKTSGERRKRLRSIASLLLHGQDLLAADELPPRVLVRVEARNSAVSAPPILAHDLHTAGTWPDRWLPRLHYAHDLSQAGQMLVMRAQKQLVPGDLLSISAAAAMLAAAALYALGVAWYLSVDSRRRERWQARRSINRERYRAAVTLDALHEAVATTDTRGRIEYLNAAMAKLGHIEIDSARGATFQSLFRFVTEGVAGDYDIGLARCATTGKPILPNSGVSLRREDGDIAVDVAITPLREPDGRLSGMAIVVKDISAHRSITERLSHEASHDPLTNLANRRAFERELAQTLRDHRTAEVAHALLYVDLDHFKAVNDRCGHEAGDELLRTLATRLTQRFRGSDIIARLGGDEFALLLKNCHAQYAREVAEQLVGLVENLDFNYHGVALRIGASVGLMMLDSSARDGDAVMRCVDQACYRAKSSPQTRVVVVKEP